MRRPGRLKEPRHEERRVLLVQDGERRVRLVGEAGVARGREGDERRGERDRVREA